MIEVDNITVQLGSQKIIKDLSMTVEPGSFFVLLGANGAGKSTLLKTMAAHYSPVKGSISFKGSPLTEWNEHSLAKHRSVLSQQIVMTFSMKVIEVVLLGRYPYLEGKASGIKDVAIAYEVLDLMGLARQAEMDIMKLSGGQQQRVHIARVLAQIWTHTAENPAVIFLDEPTSSLDIVYQQLLFQLLQKRCVTHGLTVITVLHDMNLAAQYASHIALLKQGELVKMGLVEEVLTEEWIKETFGVSAFIQRHPILNCIQISMY